MEHTSNFNDIEHDETVDWYEDDESTSYNFEDSDEGSPRRWKIWHVVVLLVVLILVAVLLVYVIMPYVVSLLPAPAISDLPTPVQA